MESVRLAQREGATDVPEDGNPPLIVGLVEKLDDGGAPRA